MGVFNISPVDKGGQLYQPSSTVARIIGPKMSPISFASLHAWETAQMHTVSVGFARPEDLDEILEAAELFTRKKEMKALLEGAKARLIKHAEEKLGKEWVEKSALNLPSCFEESTKGVAMGHVLWCYNELNAYGMYDTARGRYTKLESSNRWYDKKSFEENIKIMSNGNPGRAYDPAWDLKLALQNHYDPATAFERIKECHELLQKATKPLGREERMERGWDAAYDLRPWDEFPDSNRANPIGVVIQNITHGWFGTGGGPTKESICTGNQFREIVRNAATSH